MPTALCNCVFFPLHPVLSSDCFLLCVGPLCPPSRYPAFSFLQKQSSVARELLNPPGTSSSLRVFTFPEVSACRPEPIPASPAVFACPSAGPSQHILSDFVVVVWILYTFRPWRAGAGSVPYESESSSSGPLSSVAVTIAAFFGLQSVQSPHAPHMQLYLRLLVR